MTTALLPRPRALLFDWDNTLIDSWDTIHAALVVTFEAMGHEPWTMAETKLRVARSLRDSFPALFGERWEEARKLYLDTFTAIHLERLRPIEGAEALLTELAADGFYLGVVSNKTGRVLRREAEHLGWTHHFRRLVGAGDAAVDKPMAAPVLLALEGSGISCAETWYVGDTALDLECAKNAGCVGVLLGARALEEESFARFPPALHSRSCMALQEYVGGL
ncbi:MAG TPA: HAD family hydrolase [Stellaceae bacterium]|nr:HAD family hydrolase [Stellaceae bacterium]